MKRGLLFSICFMVLGALAFSGASVAGDKGAGSMSGGMGHGSMSGMQGDAKMEGHGMMQMGDKVFEGKIGPLHGEARLVDMKAQMKKAKVSDKMMANMKNTHHIAISLTDPATKKAVTEGKGTVTVTGPDKKTVTTDLMGMQGHFGADVNIPVPGEYTFQVKVEAGGKEGSATFHHTVK